MKRALLLLAGVLAYAALCVWLALEIPDSRCPEGECASPDEAVALVPADALAYAHADLEQGSDQLTAGARLVAALPQSSAEALRRFSGLLPSRALGDVDFGSDIAPWFAGEAAVAVLPSAGGQPEQVVLLEIGDSAGAAEFASSLGPSRRQIELDGATIDVDARDTARARVGDFLAIGGEDALRDVIATETGEGDGDSLAAADPLGRARAELPGTRIADAYLSVDGIALLAGEERAPLATLAPFISPESSQGFYAAASATGDALEVRALSVLDPERASAESSFFGAFPAFAPELDARLDPGTLAYAGVGDPAATAEALLGQASAVAPGIAEGFDDLSRELARGDQAPALAAQLAAGFGEEAAIALAPGGGDEQDAAVPPSADLLASLSDADAAREALATLQIPLAEALGGGLGGATFEETEIAGQPASSVQISPALGLAYSIAGEELAASSSEDALEGLIAGDGGLDANERYERALQGFAGEPVLLVYLDLAGLISLGERSGLGADPIYAQLAEEFRRLEGFGLEVSRRDGLLATEARLLIGSEG